MRSRLAGARLFEHACGTAASGARSSRLSPRPSVGALSPSMPLAFRRPSTPTIGMIANSAFTSSGRPSSDEPPADNAAGDAHLFSGFATASSGVAMSGAARQVRTAERLIGLIGAGAKPSAAVSASNMASAPGARRFPGNYRRNRGAHAGACKKKPASCVLSYLCPSHANEQKASWQLQAESRDPCNAECKKRLASFLI